MFLLEVRLAAGAQLALPAEHLERGVYVVDGALTWGTLSLSATQMAIQAGPSAPLLIAQQDSRVMLFGGAPLDGERHLCVNRAPLGASVPADRAAGSAAAALVAVQRGAKLVREHDVAATVDALAVWAWDARA
ncbi:MAG: hypothetical protein WDW38_004716 [Sanguina aurantia]